jgi:hypothetical protein
MLGARNFFDDWGRFLLAIADSISKPVPTFVERLP